VSKKPESIKPAVLRLFVGMITVALAAIACRQEPKTPPNSPVPELQRTEDETPKTPPSPLPTKDGG